MISLSRIAASKRPKRKFLIDLTIELLTLCNRLYVSNDPVWLTQGTPYHLLYVLARILEAFADAPNSVSYGER